MSRMKYYFRKTLLVAISFLNHHIYIYINFAQITAKRFDYKPGIMVLVSKFGRLKIERLHF